MAEKDILKDLEYYGLEALTIDEAIDKYGKDAFEKIRGSSFNRPEHFTQDVIDAILLHFGKAPYDGFSILHNLAAKCPEKSSQLLERYLERFPSYPKDALEEFYYLCANDNELLTPQLLDAVLDHSSASPFTVIMTLRMLHAKRKELLTKRMVEWVRDNVDHGANQAFYFLRDIAKEYPEHVPICVQALFDCVLKFHSNAYKKDFLSDIISIAHASHIHSQIAQELTKPIEGGNPAAKELMALIFRQKNQRKQMLLLQELELALSWDRIWDFVVFLLENPTSKKDKSTDSVERFLDGIFRLSYLLTSGDFKKEVYDMVDMTTATPVEFAGELSFLNTDGLPLLQGKVAIFAKRLGEVPQLDSVKEFMDRGTVMRNELEALDGRISKETDTKKREMMSKRRDNLRQRLQNIDNVPKSAMNHLRNHVVDELRDHLVRQVDALLTRTRKEAVRKASIRVLGYESDLWNTDESIYPALFMAEKLGGGETRRYLVRLIEDRINKRPHDWLWTEKPVFEWIEKVKASQPEADLSLWRHQFKRQYVYEKKLTDEEKRKRIASDLAEMRKRLADHKIEVSDDDGYSELLAKLEKAKDVDPREVTEIKNDLERIRRYMVAPVSDFQGTLTFEIETDPFQYLFMGEFGFASCLSMQGINFWGAASNAIDVDKVVVWAKDEFGNIIARRLLALTPEGILSYRTYSNRQSLALDRFFKKFIKEYAQACHVKITSKGTPGPLLSDKWYDDRAVEV